METPQVDVTVTPAEPETSVTAETLRLAEAAGEATATAENAQQDAAQAQVSADIAQSTAEAAGQAAAAAVAVTMEAFSALAAQVAELTTRVEELESADDEELETLAETSSNVTPIAPAPEPVKQTEKPKDNQGMLSVLFR